METLRAAGRARAALIPIPALAGCRQAEGVSRHGDGDETEWNWRGRGGADGCSVGTDTGMALSRASDLETKRTEEVNRA